MSVGKYFAECGYYVMKFMKEMAYEGADILNNDNVREGVDEYLDVDVDVDMDMDGIRDQWSSYAATFF
ncbi:hypothetical protein Hanom_Chr06g00478541 [Helianthus anomalus]